SLRVIKDARNPYIASGPSKRRIIRLNPLDIEANDLSPEQKIELLDAVGAPLRGWVIADDTVEAGTAPLDPLGLRALGIISGTSVQLRPLYTPLVEYRTAPVK
ncbi:MAG: hypothetical protein CFH10_01622, partial [Alphaproteobacteria bacterium MarineAlpha4_Bin2]